MYYVRSGAGIAVIETNAAPLVGVAPILAKVALVAVANQRIRSLRGFQARLVGGWSETVAGTAERP